MLLQLLETHGVLLLRLRESQRERATLTLAGRRGSCELELERSIRRLGLSQLIYLSLE